ncbi:pentapeptide repeat-containing protein [Frigoribacterium sp. CFBP 13712]|uniref:pentapeptide repeat-containing protein n=1 Tax=Frigoribacterium sp. CFBP 13712 TaxID=2775309 RepID=UPI001781ED7D|nr:pentapeptide repeat-containing protein [Frigoribacterium sp. CFBP 13712]MBD8702675.1 pentapeptide repeat-containing protein [Frigoribacterium sp. CFBP 13712]
MTPPRRSAARSVASVEYGTDAPRLDPVDPRGLVDVGSDGSDQPGTDHPSTDLPGPHDSRELERYVGADLTDRDLEGTSFSECVFESPRLGAARLRGARFVESVLSDSFAPELAASRSTWHDVRVERPRWGSAELFDADLRSVRIVGGKIDYLNLRGARLTDVVIEGCSIGELDLGGVTALRVALVDCRVGTLDVTRASLAHTDLRTTSFSRIDGLAGLSGATIDDDQLSMLAPVLAAHLGLVVD